MTTTWKSALNPSKYLQVIKIKVPPGNLKGEMLQPKVYLIKGFNFWNKFSQILIVILFKFHVGSTSLRGNLIYKSLKMKPLFSRFISLTRDITDILTVWKTVFLARTWYAVCLNSTCINCLIIDRATCLWLLQGRVLLSILFLQTCGLQ